MLRDKRKAQDFRFFSILCVDFVGKVVVEREREKKERKEGCRHCCESDFAGGLALRHIDRKELLIFLFSGLSPILSYTLYTVYTYIYVYISPFGFFFYPPSPDAYYVSSPSSSFASTPHSVTEKVRCGLADVWCVHFRRLAVFSVASKKKKSQKADTVKLNSYIFF